MSNEVDASIDLAPQPSLRALKILFALHVVAIVLLLVAVPPGAPMMLLAAAFGLSWFSLRRHPAFGYGPKALTRLTWHGDGKWTVHNTAGSSEAELLPASYVHPKLLVLNFRTGTGKRRTRVLVGDELPEDQLRQLRARLSLGSGT